VSTDYDTADRLYFEPLTFEDVLDIVEHERPRGVIVQLGGQTPLKLARGLEAAGVPIWGTSAAAIHAAEDRDAFHALCARLGIPQPAGGVASDGAEARRLAAEIGYPVMVRPSYVLGGRAMQIVRDEADLEAYLSEAYAELEGSPSILVDEFVAGATEVDVDALSDGETTVVAGIMEHIEGAGIHSGDSACIVPPVTISADEQARLAEYTVRLAEAIGVRGLINVQYVIKEGAVLVIEANPRASRTIPYLSKAVGHPLAKYAALIAAGVSLREIGFTESPVPPMFSVKEVVLPFAKFAGVMPLLGPEMRSTGESMGIDPDPYLAYAKALAGANVHLPESGRVRCLGLGAADPLLGALAELGFEVVTQPPADPAEIAHDALLVDLLHTSALRSALEEGVPYLSTREAARWAIEAMRRRAGVAPRVHALQDLHPARAAAAVAARGGAMGRRTS
jgi:carbamoyl-phosphate synthase large subunit